MRDRKKNTLINYFRQKHRIHVLCQCARDSHTLEPRSQLYQPDTLPFCDDLTFLPSCLMRRSAAACAWAEKRPGLRARNRCQSAGWPRLEAALSLSWRWRRVLAGELAEASGRLVLRMRMYLARQV